MQVDWPHYRRSIAEGYDCRLGLHTMAIDLSMKAAILSGLNDFVSDSIFNFPRVPTFATNKR